MRAATGSGGWNLAHCRLPARRLPVPSAECACVAGAVAGAADVAGAEAAAASSGAVAVATDAVAVAMFRLDSCGRASRRRPTFISAAAAKVAPRLES